VSVREEPHLAVPNSAAISSRPISSKSLGTAISPFMKQGDPQEIPWPRWDHARKGLPALAMMKDSPRATRATSRESCVFASWMFTVVIAAIVD